MQETTSRADRLARVERLFGFPVTVFWVTRGEWYGIAPDGLMVHATFAMVSAWQPADLN